MRAERLGEEYRRGFRLGRRMGRAAAVTLLKRPAETGDLATVIRILEDLARSDHVDHEGSVA